MDSNVSIDVIARWDRERPGAISQQGYADALYILFQSSSGVEMISHEKSI